MNAPDVFEECYQTSPNRLQPDWCWIARGAHALALGEPRFGPPAILDGIEIFVDGRYFYTFLRHDEPVVVAIEESEFTPSMLLTIASRAWWERQWGPRWWAQDSLSSIVQRISALRREITQCTLHELVLRNRSFPYEYVRNKALTLSPGSHQPPNQDGLLRPIGWDEFCDTIFPLPEAILSPWLTLPGLTMVFAERGIGKTLFVAGVAYAAATGGSFLGWQAPAARRVLILDGEMPAGELQSRFKALEAQNGVSPRPENLCFLTADQSPAGLPDLSTEEGQRELEPHLAGFDLVVLDNLSTLCRTGIENDAESWSVVQAWLIRQRSAGRSVLMVHHAGKSGAQRGTSKREDVLGTVVQLKRPAGYQASEGARFEIHFGKARGFFGDDASPLVAHYLGNGRWTYGPLEAAQADEIAERYRKGETVRDIATTLSRSTSTISHALKAAGVSTKRGRRKRQPD